MLAPSSISAPHATPTPPPSRCSHRLHSLASTHLAANNGRRVAPRSSWARSTAGGGKDACAARLPSESRRGGGSPTKRTTILQEQARAPSPTKPCAVSRRLQALLKGNNAEAEGIGDETNATNSSSAGRRREGAASRDKLSRAARPACMYRGCCHARARRRRRRRGSARARGASRRHHRPAAVPRRGDPLLVLELELRSLSRSPYLLSRCRRHATVATGEEGERRALRGTVTTTVTSGQGGDLWARPLPTSLPAGTAVAEWRRASAARVQERECNLDDRARAAEIQPRADAHVNDGSLAARTFGSAPASYVRSSSSTANRDRVHAGPAGRLEWRAWSASHVALRGCQTGLSAHSRSASNFSVRLAMRIADLQEEEWRGRRRTRQGGADAVGRAGPPAMPVTAWRPATDLRGHEKLIAGPEPTRRPPRPVLGTWSKGGARARRDVHGSSRGSGLACPERGEAGEWVFFAEHPVPAGDRACFDLLTARGEQAIGGEQQAVLSTQEPVLQVRLLDKLLRASAGQWDCCDALRQPARARHAALLPSFPRGPAPDSVPRIFPGFRPRFSLLAHSPVGSTAGAAPRPSLPSTLLSSLLLHPHSPRLPPCPLLPSASSPPSSASLHRRAPGTRLARTFTHP